MTRLARHGVALKYAIDPSLYLMLHGRATPGPLLTLSPGGSHWTFTHHPKMQSQIVDWLQAMLHDKVVRPYTAHSSRTGHAYQATLDPNDEHAGLVFNGLMRGFSPRAHRNAGRGLSVPMSLLIHDPEAEPREFKKYGALHHDDAGALDAFLAQFAHLLRDTGTDTRPGETVPEDYYAL